MVWCVVLNWNGADDTLACLEALSRQTVPLHVIVVDNASTDDSEARLRAWIAAQPPAQAVGFELLQAGRNGGFAAGNNAGMRRALGEPDTRFVWLLNNDTVPPPDTLACLLRAAGREPRAGLVGSVLVYAHNPARVQAWGGGRMVPAIGYTSHVTGPAQLPARGWNDPRTYATFASVLLRREALEAAGLLDESFFMYYEDADLNLRLRRAGWGIALAADTRIPHREGGSRQQRASTWTETTTTQSALRFIGKHARWPGAGQLAFLVLRLGKRLLSGNVAAMRAVLRGAAAYRAARRAAS